MRFLFVDRIDDYSETTVMGWRYFAPTEACRYDLATGQSVVASGVIAEAIGQLASWLCLKLNDFTKRPVFMFADAIEVARPAPTGAPVRLEATLERFDDESVIFSGRATNADGELIQELKRSSCYLLPLGQLEDPEVARARFEALTHGGLDLVDSAAASSLAYPFAERIGTWQTDARGTHSAEVTLGANEPFYADHFPRFPVTPIVVLNELIGNFARKVLAVAPGSYFSARSIENLKIRSFVAPGETFTIRLQPSPSTGVTRMRAEILKAGKPILRGDYVY